MVNDAAKAGSRIGQSKERGWSGYSFYEEGENLLIKQLQDGF